MRSQKRVTVVIGTRPEAVKLAPVILRLSESPGFKTFVLCTGQHRELVDSVLTAFGIQVYHRLDLKRANDSLWNLSAALISRLGNWFQQNPTDAVLVQGDTSSAFFAGLAAYYHRIPVGHIEAGLRTGNKYSPFPEEVNRRFLTTVATWHFAPTKAAAERLKQSCIDPKSIFLTGNTVIDAMQRILPPNPNLYPNPTLLVTCHRRESFGLPMRALAKALRIIAQKNPNIRIVFPIHPNPAIEKAVAPELSRVPNVILSGPMPYAEFLRCLTEAHLVLSDSGGVQEEATALGKPVLVLRNETERQEGIENGSLKLIGVQTGTIIRETERLLHDPKAYRAMCRPSDVFGDGKASERIVRILTRELK